MIIHILQNTWVIPFVSDFNLLSIVFISESISDYISDFNKPIFFQYVTNTSIFIWSIKNSRAKATWMSLSYQVKLVVYIAILVFFLDSLKLCGLLKIHTLKMYLNSFPQFFLYMHICVCWNWVTSDVGVLSLPLPWSWNLFLVSSLFSGGIARE